MLKIVLMVAVCLAPTAYGAVPEHQFNPTLLSLVPDWHQKCVMYTGTTEDLIQQAKDGKFPEDDSLKRYNNCIWTHHNFLVDDKRVVNLKKLLYLLPKGWESVGKTIKQCNTDVLNTGENDDVEFYWKIMKCYHDKVDPSQYFFY
uniref:Odorant-binding protein 35 n=1 Tax=Pyrrhalta maculicollis TaxID=226885 RepID=A0A1J0KKB4_9CUCU|nr:odorant-binding protein 35 [Pyrrhalta maculicollis]